MRGYIKHFRYLFISIGILTIILGIIVGFQAIAQKATYEERNNKECVESERVFDYADKLTDQEEDKLRKLISKREK